MKLGLSVFPTMASIHPTRLGREAEARGFESIFTVEHTHIPASRRTPYPLGGDLPSTYWESFEPFTFLSMVAAVTRTLRIGTGICLVPQHHPIALAKRVASLDALSGGRFLFGVGAGWNAEELENHGVRYQERWKVLDESIAAMKTLWTEKDAGHHGHYFDFDPVWVEPKPLSQPHPPVLIGAASKWAIRRVVDYADGWLPVAVGDQLDERLEQMQRLCEETGRDRDTLSVSVIGFVQSPAELEVLARKGIDRVVLGVPTVEESQLLKILDGFAPIVAAARELSAT